MCLHGLGETLHRRGTILLEDVDHPFTDIVIDIASATDDTPEQMAGITRDLDKFCPVAKVIRGSGVTITETRTTVPL